MRVVGCLLVALATFLVASTARADDPLRLTWSAPGECPTAASVRAAALRGAPPGASAPIEAEAVVARSSRWSVTLRTRRGDVRGERTIEADTCAALADATAVILALALVPPFEDAPPPTSSAPPPASATTTDPPEASAPAPPAEAPPSLPVVAEERSTPEPPRRRAPSAPALAIGAWGAADPTTLPSPALGGGGSVAWTPGALRIEAGAAAWTAQSRTVPGSTAGARFSMTSLGAGACHAIVRRSVDLAPCLGASLHLVSASGFGATDNYDASARWVSADGGALARMPVGAWLALRVRADALVPLSRPTFAVENEGIVHRAPPIGLRASVGAELTFL